MYISFIQPGQYYHVQLLNKNIYPIKDVKWTIEGLPNVLEGCQKYMWGKKSLVFFALIFR